VESTAAPGLSTLAADSAAGAELTARALATPLTTCRAAVTVAELPAAASAEPRAIAAGGAAITAAKPGPIATLSALTAKSTRASLASPFATGGAAVAELPAAEPRPIAALAAQSTGGTLASPFAAGGAAVAKLPAAEPRPIAALAAKSTGGTLASPFAAGGAAVTKLPAAEPRPIAALVSLAAESTRGALASPFAAGGAAVAKLPAAEPRPIAALAAKSTRTSLASPFATGGAAVAELPAAEPRPIAALASLAAESARASFALPFTAGGAAVAKLPAAEPRPIAALAASFALPFTAGGAAVAKLPAAEPRPIAALAAKSPRTSLASPFAAGSAAVAKLPAAEPRPIAALAAETARASFVSPFAAGGAAVAKLPAAELALTSAVPAAATAETARVLGAGGALTAGRNSRLIIAAKRAATLLSALAVKATWGPLATLGALATTTGAVRAIAATGSRMAPTLIRAALGAPSALFAISSAKSRAFPTLLPAETSRGSASIERTLFAARALATLLSSDALLLRPPVPPRRKPDRRLHSGRAPLRHRAQRLDLRRRQRPDLPRLEPLQPDPRVVRPEQPDHRVPDGRAEPLHQVRPPLPQHQLDPRVLLRPVEHVHRQRLCHPVLEPHAPAKLLHRRFVRRPLHLRQVRPRHAEAGMHQPVRQLPIIREQQRALGVVVQPPHRVDPPPHPLQEVRHRGPALRVAQRGDHALRLVEDEVPPLLRRLHQLPVHLDEVLPGLHLGARFAHHLAVHLHPPLGDELLRVTPRRHPRLRQELLQSLRHLNHLPRSSSEARAQARPAPAG